MEELDSSLQPEHTGGKEAPVTARRTLTRCCSIPQQLSSVPTDKLSEVGVEDQSGRSPGLEEAAVAIGTGEYFQKLPSNCGPSADSDVCELQDLFNLATVVCEVETKHRQLVKKRRTPRNVLWINSSNGFASSNRKRIFPAEGGGDDATRQRIELLNAGRLCTPSWLAEQSVLQDPSAFTSKLTCKSFRHSSNAAATLNFSPQRRTVGGKMMAMNQPAKRLRIKLTNVSNGKNGLPSLLSSSKPPRVRRFPRKDTRVEGMTRRILQIIAGGSTAEKFIRGTLGNNPDTSKALRLLLTQRKIYRVGDGGRGKVFMYVATPAGLSELEQFTDQISADEDGQEAKHQDDKIGVLIDDVSTASKAPGVLLTPPRIDVDTSFSKASFSKGVLQAVFGQTAE